MIKPFSIQDAIEEIRRKLDVISRRLDGNSRVDEAVIRAVTGLAEGLQDLSDQVAVLTEQKQIEDLEDLVPVKPNGHPKGAAGRVPVVQHTAPHGEDSGSIKIVAEFTGDQAREGILKTLKWVGAVLSLAGTAVAGWLAAKGRP